MRLYLPLRALALTVAPLLVAASPVGKSQPLSADLSKMLDAALKSGNEGDINTVAKYLRAAAPDSADTVAARIAAWQRKRTETQVATLRHASFFSLVKGQIEFGGFMTSGNSEDAGVHAKLDLKRDGLTWRHKLQLLAEYQQSHGITSREHYLVGLESNYKFDDRFYAYGAAQFESDRFFGFDQRIGGSLGLGYSARQGALTTLDVELGPAFRLTDFTNGIRQRNLAARGSIDVALRLSNALTLKNSSQAFLESANSTVASVTALNARLFGPVSGQFSYGVQFESAPPVGRKTTDTTSRAALVYQF